MADYLPTTGDLLKAKAIIESDVVAAVDAFMADPTTAAFLLGDGYRIDLAAALAASTFATLVFKDGHATEYLKRAAVRTAILLARPEKK